MDSRPWLKNYPKGVPANIDADAFPSVVAMIDSYLEKYAKLEAFSCMGATLTYAELDKYATQFGAYLQSRGLQPGDRIALMMPNLLQYPIALFGALRAGLVIVNTNPLYTPREMEHQFTDAGVKGIIIAENFCSNLEKILSHTAINTIIVTSIGEMLGTIKGGITNFVVRNVKRMVPKYNLPNTVSFKEAMKQGKKFTIERPQSKPEDTIIIQYTGGTTGVAKGAMLTNRNLVANVQQVRAIMVPKLQEGKEVTLCPLPLYHIFAFTVNCLSMCAFGAKNVLITNPRDLSTIVKAFKQYPISLLTAVNTLFNALLNHKAFTEVDHSALKVTVAGGMALQNVVAEKWEQVTGCPLSEGYGMTETSPVASVNPLDGTGRIGTIGLPIPSTDMRVVSDTGALLEVGQVGEIQIKGPQVMKGYYERQDETERVLTPEGWIFTGDIGMMNEDGFFQIVDRKKDMILVSGFNVYPNEVEDVVAKHPKVLEVAAIGIPSDKSGEVVKLFVVKKDKSLTKEEIVAFCRESLTGYKIPREIEFRNELPKTNVGKILRRALKEEEKG